MTPLKPFTISCHALSEIMAGSVGLTEIQVARLEELSTRKRGAANGEKGVKPLTDNMEKELSGLFYKRDNPQLPDGAKTYVKKWLKRKMFNRNEEWKSLVIEKGLCCEPMGIELLSRVTGIQMDKNDEFFDNEYAHGCPDILTDHHVRDTKLSWDLFTFPMFENELPKPEYWWQLQCYMWLTGLRKASLDYILIDTPMPLIQQDLKKLYFQSGGKPEDWKPEAYEAMYPNYMFTDIPEHLRVKSFEFEYDSSIEAKVIERVQLCRKYVETLVTSDYLQNEILSA